MDFTLEPGAFFMLCRDPDYIAESRTCHQQESFNIRNNRKQFITTQRITDNSQQGTVDEVTVPISRKHETEAYVRSADRYCSTDCWTWAPPATAPPTNRPTVSLVPTDYVMWFVCMCVCVCIYIYIYQIHLFFGQIAPSNKFYFRSFIYHFYAWCSLFLLPSLSLS